MEGCPYTMGYLHYGDPRREMPIQKVTHFCVSAPTIMNEKYADYNSELCHEDVGQLEPRCEERKAIPTTRAVGCGRTQELQRRASCFYNVRDSFQDDFELSMGELGMKNKTLAPELANLIENVTRVPRQGTARQGCGYGSPNVSYTRRTSRNVVTYTLFMRTSKGGKENLHCY